MAFGLQFLKLLGAVLAISVSGRRPLAVCVQIAAERNVAECKGIRHEVVTIKSQTAVPKTIDLITLVGNVLDHVETLR